MSDFTFLLLDFLFDVKISLFLVVLVVDVVLIVFSLFDFIFEYLLFEFKQFFLDFLKRLLVNIATKNGEFACACVLASTRRRNGGPSAVLGENTALLPNFFVHWRSNDNNCKI